MIKARFIGKDGSMGLKKGDVYEIRTSIQYGLLWVIWNENSCPYRNLESFLRNWKLIN